MLIIAGHVHVDPAHRDQFVAAHRDLVGRARAAPGCLDLAISADSMDPTRVNTFERWESQEHLDAWREVADSPDLNIETIDDQVRMYTATDERSPFE
jgi:quinol monooxygenase YgiN